MNNSMKQSQVSFAEASALTTGGKTLAQLSNATGRPVIESYKSTVHKAPEMGFGTALRGNINGTTIESPGPGAYRSQTTLQPNVTDSRIKGAPQFSLKGREKFGAPDLKAIDPTTIREPGPGHYTPKIVNPQEPIASKHSFPRDQRRPIGNTRKVPGPGAYNSHSSLGQQIISTKRTMRRADFGSGNRPPLLINTSAEVGPGEYDATMPACEAQVDSRKTTTGTTKFGKASRDAPVIGARMNTDVTPGPGKYKLPKGICGAGSSHPYKSAPAPSMSGRTKFGSPF
mmetsp:Transcript_33253/g.43835  ORF Transcript_33253/g.43835 Transcript_33253/m.43835 type:complete len:285 (+) Transcript_33253:132-986(+)